MANEQLKQDVLDHIIKLGHSVTWPDLEHVAGGRCPWKRLGELEEDGLLVCYGTVPGKYGRQVKLYGVPNA